MGLSRLNRNTVIIFNTFLGDAIMVRVNRRFGRNVFGGMLLLSIISCTLFSSAAFSEEATVEAMESVAEAGRTCALGGDDAGADAALSQLYSQYFTQPQVVPAIERIAQTFFSKNNIAKAQAIYSDAITKISADHPNAVWLHKRVILCQIAQDNITGADQSIEAFKNIFSGKPKLSIVLLGLADDFTTHKKYDKAKDLWQYVSQNTSDASLAIKAKSAIILYETRLGNDTAADQAITALMNDHSAAPEFCTSLLALAKNIDKLNKFDKAKVLSQYVAQNSTDSSQVLTAKTYTACMDIKLGNDSAAEQAITALMNDYSGSQELCNSILIFAKDYEKSKKLDKAIELYRYFAKNSSDSNKAIDAQKMVAVLGIYNNDDTAIDAAIVKLKSDFSEHPQLCKNIHEIAMKCWFNKEYAKAKGLYYYVSQNSSDKKMAFFSLERALKCELRLDNHGAMAEAIESLSGLDSASEDYVDKVLTICGVYIKTYDPTVALPHVNSALQVSQDNEKTKKLLEIKAKCYASMGDDEQANAILGQIAQSDATDEEYFVTLNRTADKYRDQGHYEKSIELYQQVIDSDADKDQQLDAHIGIVRSNFKLGNDPNVTAAVKTICADFADQKKLGRGICDIAEDYYYARKIERAKELSLLAHEHTKDSGIAGESAYIIALCSNKLKDSSTQMKYYHIIMEKYPKSIYAYRVPYRMASIYMRQGNYGQAEYWFMKQRELYDDSDNGGRATYGLARLYKEGMNDLAKATEVLENYKQWYPSGRNMRHVYLELAICYQKMGKKEEAVSELQSALEKYTEANYVKRYNELLNEIQKGSN